ncbi:lytic murein transglycosylase [Rhizobium sp. EC-SD404]|uniref:lytic murein transglycosylase n=1 Tax=Rhizobium sp. EC-SD404 TaxID=2038389 RepID=UPI00125435E1|nr:lytic murein transglycosylase [Rhizobium sp. EC-SD404]VVT26453.1 Membrane-bound lytic murein transglycosylase B [Rhizobium sp. EC-SD404]
MTITTSARKSLLGIGTGILATLLATSAFAQQCGGDFGQFLQGVRAEAVAQGLSQEAADRVLGSARQDQQVLNHDRSQSVFRMNFIEFSQRIISNNRMQQGQAMLQRNASVFARAEQEFGVPGPVIAAFWGLETDFGAVQGDINTVNALATLAHDCRRPELFRPQLIGAISMAERGDLDPATMTGAWAGEIGQVQMLPADIIEFGVDGDGDGHVNVKTSSADAILTGANFIRSLGWRPGEPWLQEVTIPENLPWDRTGLSGSATVGEWQSLGVSPRNGSLPDAGMQARLIMPQGRFGPVFLAYPNFDVYLEWNQSFIYTTSAAYFGTRLAGADRYAAGNPPAGLSPEQMMDLQGRLQARGYNVGDIDGILGAGTRDAVRAEQLRLGLPADAWPTPELLSQL